MPTSRTLTISLLGLCLFTGLTSRALAGETSTSGYKVLQTWAIGGSERWDYLSIDPAARRLYVARSTHVSVIDADSGKVLGDIPDTAGVHGVAIASEQGHGFTSNGKDDSVWMFDLATIKPIKKIKVGKKPDAIIFDPATKRVFVMNGKSEDTTAIDAASGDVVGTVALGGGPEFAASDGKGKIYINLEEQAETLEVDAVNLKVLSRWSLKPSATPTGLAIDRETGRLFVGCRSKQMVVLNVADGKPVASLPIGAGVDATAYDPETKLAFASNGDGTLTIVGESAGKYTVLDNIATVKGAKTMALDPKSHRVLLGAAKADGFAILVVGKP